MGASGGVWRRGSLACRMWVYWQGVRVHIEHDVHARELDFLVKDDLVGREVSMVHFFKCSTPFDLHLTGHFTTFDEVKGHFDWCNV